MLSRIYLIRHGRTAGNLNHWYYGSTDLPLTDDGYEEIKAYQESGIYPDIPEENYGQTYQGAEICTRNEEIFTLIFSAISSPMNRLCFSLT